MLLRNRKRRNKLCVLHVHEHVLCSYPQAAKLGTICPVTSWHYMNYFVCVCVACVRVCVCE